MIREVCPTMKPDRAATIEAIFGEVCAKYGIVSKNDKAAFLAQMAHESGEFTIKQERMNYTTPQRIVDIWPSRFNLTGEGGKLNANEYINNAEKLANEVYANRMGNGNQESGDGFKYRGGGFLQLTGKEDYQKCADYVDIPVEEFANLIHQNDQSAMESAAWEYVIEKKLLGETDFQVITQRINGGLTNYADRKKYFNRALAVIS